MANQIAASHHYWVIDGQLEQFSSPHRYVWPAELDLMARLAGLTLRDRWSNWDSRTFHERKPKPHLGLAEGDRALTQPAG